MALTASPWLILNALSQGVSPITGFPVTTADLANEDVKQALEAGAKAIVAANQPKLVDTKAKKGGKGSRGPRKPKAVVVDAISGLNGQSATPPAIQTSLLGGSATNGASASH